MGIGENMFPVIGTFLFIAIFSNYGKANVNINSRKGGPEWEDLECERGYKYLFSDLEVTWQDAIAECTLYGGHLVDVTSQQEHNCLMRYGISQNFNSWFWIDANDQASRGTWVHAKKKFALQRILNGSIQKRHAGASGTMVYMVEMQ